MAEISSYTSKYSGDQLDAAIAALGSLQGLFASKKDFDDFVAAFNSKMNEFINQTNATIATANNTLKESNENITTANNNVTAAQTELKATNETLQTMIKGSKLYFVEIDDKGNEKK